MGKIIAVCGSPNSGKTTMALKLAQEIYAQKKTTVMFISPDLDVPCMAYIFPDGKDSDLYSLGVALDKTDIYREDVLRQMVNEKTRENFGYLGFKLGENRYSYPNPTEDKILQLFTALRECCEYIVVDCTCDTDDLFSSIAKRDCDIAVQLFVPDLKCISYYASCGDQFLLVEDKRIKVLNITEKDIYLPIKETENHFKGMNFILPYERGIKQQMITGTLTAKLSNCKYKTVIEKIAKMVV